MAAPQKSADGSVTVETRWKEGKGQFVNEFVLDISLLMEVLSGYLVRIFSLIVVASQAMVVVEKMGHDICLCGSGILG
jgi:hypothetical protein